LTILWRNIVTFVGGYPTSAPIHASIAMQREHSEKWTDAFSRSPKR
jgi:hypothetical protein